MTVLFAAALLASAQTFAAPSNSPARDVDTNVTMPSLPQARFRIVKRGDPLVLVQLSHGVVNLCAEGAEPLSVVGTNGSATIRYGHVCGPRETPSVRIDFMGCGIYGGTSTGPVMLNCSD